MLKCVECGHLVKEKEEFCDGCGASMEVYNRWFKGAEENDAFSQASLGVIYRNEKLSVVDLEKSFYWTKKGAEGGDSNAQGALGGMYLNGQGTEVDFEKSYYWTRKSAEQGNTTAKWNLACDFLQGTGVEKDVFKAIYWLIEARKDGYEDAANLLEKMNIADAHFFSEDILASIKYINKEE